MSIKGVELQSSDGSILYPHSDARLIRYGETTVEEELKILDQSGYLDLSKDANEADYKTIKTNGFYRNVTGTPTSGKSGILQVITNTDKWGIVYKWSTITNSIIDEYIACKDGDNYSTWKRLVTTGDMPITFHDDNTDINTIRSNGLHRVHTNVNSPSGADMDYIIQVFNPFQDQTIIIQVLYPLWGNDGHIYKRVYNDSAWTMVQMSINKNTEIPLPLNSPFVEYEGVSSGYSNKIIKKDNGTIIISFCIKKADGSRIAINESMAVANIPIGYRIKAAFGSSSVWGGLKLSLAYIDGSHTLMCRATEEGEAIAGNIIGEAI